MSRRTKMTSGAGLTRRDFARGAALIAAAAALPQTGSAEQEPFASTQTANPQAVRLSPAAEAQLHVILSKYGSRFTEEQESELRRLIAQAQKTSDLLRNFPLENSDEPAMIFHVYRSQK